MLLFGSIIGLLLFGVLGVFLCLLLLLWFLLRCCVFLGLMLFVRCWFVVILWLFWCFLYIFVSWFYLHLVFNVFLVLCSVVLSFFWCVVAFYFPGYSCVLLDTQLFWFQGIY